MSVATGPTLEAIRAHKREIERIAETYGASKIRIFGSVARGEADEKSDIDLLVDMTCEPGGLAYFGRLEDLRADLTTLLGYPVDITDSSALRDQSTHPIDLRAGKRFRDRVLRDIVDL
jgi:uncharacterized protein